MAATHAVPPAGAVARSYEHTERVVCAIFMLVSPLILLVATIVHPKHGIAKTDGAEYYGAAYEHTTRFYIAHTGYFLTGVTLIVAFIGMNRLVRPTHPKAAFWGLVLSAMGFVGWGAIDGMDFMTFNAGRFTAGSQWAGSLGGSLDHNTMQTYIDNALGDNFVLIPVFGVFFLLIIGLVVNAVGLHRSGIVNFFHALLLPIGVTGVISFLDYPPLEIGSGLCVCAAVIPIGVRQLRARHDATAAQAAAS
ncbi:hypothetical protein OM076_37525 [Solirubrobacter ginsenosidimutans]|uniref:Uncharacterized protein n=1 Tax=Solirubrobacter ginsenosidimutans TaxID=490573 RepID=A0A9X3MZR0_9ACTN|nr:hypothetical protein [Solirubrobacter ginsenosidimutans]MDA0166026.1 hypothetical protein [Solirubrobacter ginsenosidimutans]